MQICQVLDASICINCEIITKKLEFNIPPSTNATGKNYLKRTLISLFPNSRWKGNIDQTKSEGLNK